ncbi:MAG: signal transduction histidine kinase, LytS [bacterium]|nr:signal transduction histidine kinase, LytS [bacterium]
MMLSWFAVAIVERSTAIRARPRRGLIPRETLIALVVISPLLALLLSKNVIYGTWRLRLHVTIGTLAYALALAAALLAMFDGLLMWLPPAVRQGRRQFVVYWLAAMLVVVAVTRAFVPVFSWMAFSFDPERRMVQGGVIVTLYLAGAFLFKRMSERIADEQNRALTERAAALDARFAALQARTNPHFLFNTLSSIMSLIANQPARAEELLGRLAKLLRYTIERADQAHVPLRDELDAVRDYLEIEQARFGDRLAIDICIDDDVDLAARVPPMILQPLVENAVLHGVSRSIDGGRVAVSVALNEEDRITLTVDNDGAAPGASAHTGTRTSLANLKERLQIAYGDQASLAVGKRSDGGFRAQLVLPSRRSP